MQQGAINCAEQAYEIWQYMNEQGYYQVPTMKDVTTQTMSNIYQPAGTPQNCRRARAACNGNSSSRSRSKS